MKDIATTNLNKIIAFAVTPVVAALTGTATIAAVLWLEKISGADLDDTQIVILATGLTVPAVAGVCGAAIKYLSELAVWQKLTKFGTIHAPDELDDPAAIPADEGDPGRP